MGSEMDSGNTLICKICQPGVQSWPAKGSSKYQGWSKKEGGFDGSVPNKHLKFKMLSPVRSSGVANAMSAALPETTGVVARSCFSFGVNRLGIPSKANRRSTSSGVNEIMCDNILGGVIASKAVGNFPYGDCSNKPQTRPFLNSLTSLI
jgi:hypothetical protein